MESGKEDGLIVPDNIKILFDNNKLETMKVIVLLYALNKDNKKKFYKIDDIIFYYSIVNFNMIRAFENNEEDEVINRNSYINASIYYEFLKKISNITLDLLYLKLIDIKGNVSMKKEDISVKITKHGEKFVKELNVKYFTDLNNKYLDVISRIEVNSYNKNKIKGIK